MKITVLLTGGTISQSSTAGGPAIMNFEPKTLAANLRLSAVELVFKAICRKGSKNISPDDWKLMAVEAAAAIAGGAHGVVVLHGTDTMHYSAAALSFMLQDLGAPVIFTGSMIPGGNVDSDSSANLRDAVNVAANGDLAEVCVVFSADRDRARGMIIRGNRARKVQSTAIDAFASINLPPLGYIEGDRIVYSDLPMIRRRSTMLYAATDLDTNVVLIKLSPADTPQRFWQSIEGASGAVLEGTGIGHIKNALLPIVARFAKPVVMSTQAVYGGERLGLYDDDKHTLALPNIIPVRDMTSETALVKLMWALRQTDVRRAMQTNVAGEMSGPPLL